MKKLLSLLIVITLCLPAVAQTTTPEEAVPGRFFAGFGVSNATYYLQYNERPPKGGRYTPVATVHAGYWLSKRASLQLGFGYGVNKLNFESTYVAAEDRLIHYSDKNHTRAFSAQLAGKYLITNPDRRLQLYGTASITSVWGRTRTEMSSREGDVTTISYQGKESGLNVFATAGLGLNYRISKRLELYTEVPILHRNLSGSSFQKNIMIGTGLNFRF